MPRLDREKLERLHDIVVGTTTRPGESGPWRKRVRSPAELTDAERTWANRVTFHRDGTVTFSAPRWPQGATGRRGDSKLAAWRESVLRCDGYACTKCGATKDLHAHHIQWKSRAPHLAYVGENGTTLCTRCHRKEHGRGARRREQRIAGAPMDQGAREVPS